MKRLPPEERAGLQAERTDLSWARTALSFLVNCGLLLVRHRMQGPTWLTGLAIGLAAALLLFTLYMSRRRRLMLVQRPLPDALADPLGLLLLGSGTALLGLMTLVVLLLD